MLVSSFLFNKNKEGLLQEFQNESAIDLIFRDGDIPISRNWRSETLSKKEYTEIAAAKEAPFSTIFKTHALSKLIFVLGKKAVKEKFDAEFGSKTNKELFAHFGLFSLPQLRDAKLVTKKQMADLKVTIKEAEKATPFSELLKKYDLTRLLTYFTVDELKAKCKEEWGQKSDQEILAEADPQLFLSAEGRKIADIDRFKKGEEITVKKQDGTVRKLKVNSQSFSFKESNANGVSSSFSSAFFWY